MKKKSYESTSSISDRRQLLLMKHADGECRFWERWVVQRLLVHDRSANEFLDQLKKLRTEVQQSCSQLDCKCAVWDEVDQRIAQEKRSAVFLGERRLAARETGTRAWEFLTRPAAAWTVSAMAASCAIVVSFQSAVSPQGSEAGAAGRVATLRPSAPERGLYAKQLVTDSNGSPTRYVAPRIIEERIPSTVEVDWLRGSGRVRLIPDAQTRAPIIWVKRKARTGPALALAATPTFGP